MPSRQRQQAILLTKKNGKPKGTIILVKKTGYMNVWVNGQQYYYSNVQKNVDPKKISIEKVIDDAEAQQAKRNGVIVIRRK